jgi:hypothetical protein
MKKKVVKKNQKKVSNRAVSRVSDYAPFLSHIKKDILQTQLKAAMSATKELTLLYWRIGKGLSEKMKNAGWGAKVVELLAHDLEKAFPGMSGFSRTNIYRMLAFYEAYQNCPTAAGQTGELIFATAVAKIINRGFGMHNKPSQMVGVEPCLKHG